MATTTRATRATHAPAMTDLDVRLAQVGRVGPRELAVLLAGVIADHQSAAGRCPRCGFATSRGRAHCPSAVVAAAVRDHKALPEWLSGLAVPGLPARGPSRADQRAALDDAEGLFPAPRRAS